MQFRDKVVWVTGASRGNGRATALAFAKEGAKLVISDICEDIDYCPYPLGTWDQLLETKKVCEQNGVDVLIYKCDVRFPEDINETYERIINTYGHIDILINNAGIVGPGGKPTHAFTENEWKVVLDTNINGVWRCSKAVIENMINNKQGVIVNVASTAGLVAFRAFSSYVASKHAVVGLTKAMALDYALYGIRVNCVCPTSILDEEKYESGMLKGVSDMYHIPLDEYLKLSSQGHPLNTLITAEDVADSILWLSSEKAKKVTGTTLTVDSGFTIK